MRAAETVPREVWGGALCVTQAKRTQADLSKIQREVNDTPGMIFSAAGRDVVGLHVVHDDGSHQRRMDEEYGAGVIWVDSALVSLRHFVDRGVQTRRLDLVEACRRADSTWLKRAKAPTRPG